MIQDTSSSKLSYPFVVSCTLIVLVMRKEMCIQRFVFLTLTCEKKISLLKGLRHGILSDFYHRQNYL